MRIWVRAAVVGLTALAAGSVGVLAAHASPSVGIGTIPQAGDWEGAGPHGLPLSFALARRHGHLTSTAIALGAPFTCPANERDAESIPLKDVAYSGPGGASGSSAAVLSGRVPGRGNTVHLTGAFATPATGTFSIHIKGKFGCGWPTGTLTWQVHRARRERVADGTWSAVLSAAGIVGGQVKVVVAGEGRVVQSFHSSFTCLTASFKGANRFTANPAYDFIRPSGRFYSPLHGNSIKRHRTLWTGRFSRAGSLDGTLSIYDSCTGRLVNAQFHGTHS